MRHPSYRPRREYTREMLRRARQSEATHKARKAKGREAHEAAKGAWERRRSVAKKRRNAFAAHIEERVLTYMSRGLKGLYANALSDMFDRADIPWR